MTPEATILITNATFLAFAYFWVYPNLRTKTIGLILVYDIIISGAAFLVAALLFWGSAASFSLIFFKTNWAVFSFVTMMVMETPLAAWFVAKHDMRM